jgi:hypothetical protein
MTGDDLFINSILIVIMLFLVKFMVSDEEKRLREEERREEAERRRRQAIKNSDYKYGGDALDPMVEDATWRSGYGTEFDNKMEEEKKSFGNGFGSGYGRRRRR